MAAQKIALTSKAGISMTKNHIDIKNNLTAITQIQTRAFTFIEVIVALVIVSISLLTLLKLHLVSIRMVDKAEITSQAVFLANAKIAEAHACGYPDVGTNYGTVEKNNLTLHWQTEVTDLHLPQLEQAQIGGLRKVLVDISWKQGAGWKHLEMLTCVADDKIK